MKMGVGLLLAAVLRAWQRRANIGRKTRSCRNLKALEFDIVNCERVWASQKRLRADWRWESETVRFRLSRTYVRVP